MARHLLYWLLILFLLLVALALVVSLTVTPPSSSVSSHDVRGGPSLSAAFVDQVLVAAHSPAAGTVPVVSSPLSWFPALL